MKPDSVGVILGQRLCLALSGRGIPMAELERVVYGELEAIEREQREGDWLSMPHGVSYVLERKLGRGEG